MPLKFSAYETVLKNEDKSPSESCIPFSEVKKKKIHNLSCSKNAYLSIFCNFLLRKGETRLSWHLALIFLNQSCWPIQVPKFKYMTHNQIDHLEVFSTAEDNAKLPEGGNSALLYDKDFNINQCFSLQISSHLWWEQTVSVISKTSFLGWFLIDKPWYDCAYPQR